MASTTVTSYKTQITAKAGLDTSADDALMLIWLNQAYEDIVLRTHCKVRPASLTLTAGTDTYSLPTQALAILEPYNSSSGKTGLMKPIDLTEMARKRTGQTSTSGTILYYVLMGDLLELYPAPSTGDTLNLWYVPRPTALSSGSDTPSDIPSEYHKLLEFFALAEAYEYHRKMSLMTYNKGLYEQGIKGMIKMLRGRQGRTDRIVVGYPERRRELPRDPSADVRW